MLRIYAEALNTYVVHPIFTIFWDQLNSATVRNGVLFRRNWK